MSLRKTAVVTGAIQANSERTVPVTVRVTNPEDSVRSWWSKKNVQAVTDGAVGELHVQAAGR